MSGIDSSQREQYVNAFNSTMVAIWKERIAKLGIVDTGALYNSVKSMPVRADGRFFEVSLSWLFLQYGLYQNYGTGRETPRGNSGDIGRAKVRQVKPWFSKAWARSVYNIRDFFAANIGSDFQGILSEIKPQ